MAVFEIVRRLVKKGHMNDAGNAEFMERIGHDEKALAKFVRKATYMTWDCIKCGQTFFYKVFRCPTCESRRIAVKKHPTSSLKDFQYGQIIVQNASIARTNGVLR